MKMEKKKRKKRRKGREGEWGRRRRRRGREGEETERRRVRDLLLTGVAGVITPLHLMPQENPGSDLDLMAC